MTLTTLIIAGAIVLLVVLTIIGLLSRYRKCPSDQLLVVYGKVSGKSAAKIYPGGGVFVWPVIQDYKIMSLKPFQITSEVVGPDSNMIRTHVNVALTTAISQETSTQQNAAARFLSANSDEIQRQIRTILEGEVRLIIASMSIEEINSDRDAFKAKVKECLGNELAKIGYDIINVNIQEITDEQDILKNLSKKKETDARANAEADIADKEKDGAIRKANIQKEQEIQVATADKDRETTVAQTKQEQFVKVADIEKEKETQIAETLKSKEIALAETEKNKQTGIAQQKAEQAANVANANADAESKKAEAEARKVSAIAEQQALAESNKAKFESNQRQAVAKAEAEAESVEKEQEALKQVRIIKAQQEQEAENAKNTQEKEAKKAEYESAKNIRKAKADQDAGVAEQNAKILVAEARAKAGKAEADADKTVQVAKIEADMQAQKTQQERQLEVNLAEADAVEAKLNATEIIPAEQAKKKTVIEAEAIKEKAILEAEAEKQKILKKAEGDAEAIRVKMNAEAEGTKAKKLAEAEGQKALLFAEAEALQKREMAPALALERMVQSFGGNPDLLVQYKMVDQYKDIAEAQSHVLEHIKLGNVTVYGDKNTGAAVAKSFIENFAPALDMINQGVKGQFKELFNKKVEQLPAPEEATEKTQQAGNKKFNNKKNKDSFEEVK
jgi:flotillin